MNALASSVALIVALAAAPTATPFPIGTLQPLAAPTERPLPEIGRTRANTPACAAMRDLVIPSFTAARRADARFAETKQKLPKYAEIINDPGLAHTVYRQSALARIDADANALLKESLQISKALGDPRLAANSKDPQVQAERAGLQSLFETQQARANLLTEFVTRERIATATDGMEDTGALRGRSDPPATPTPGPMAAKQPPNMPLLVGSMFSDKQAFNDWSNEISAFVRSGENESAKTFITIARACR
jgi:hypothetical protein